MPGCLGGVLDMGKVYTVFFDGKFWDSYQSKLSADRMKKSLKQSFPNVKVVVKKTERPRYQ